MSEGSSAAVGIDQELSDRLAAVRSAIADALRDASRSESEVTTVVVTKFHPESLVRRLHALGVRDFGENRHQEAEAKALATNDLDLRWHFVGQLQSNKAKRVRQYASVVHSVDRASLVDALGSATPDAVAQAADALKPDRSPLDCFIQVNLTQDPHRGGAYGDDVEKLTERVVTTSGLRLLGVMAVAPLDEESRKAFSRVAAISQRVRSIAPNAVALSAGMSADFREAILEGATHLRIGTAITGNRPVAG